MGQWSSNKMLRVQWSAGVQPARCPAGRPCPQCDICSCPLPHHQVYHSQQNWPGGTTLASLFSASNWCPLITGVTGQHSVQIWGQSNTNCGHRVEIEWIQVTNSLSVMFYNENLESLIVSITGKRNTKQYDTWNIDTWTSFWTKL